MANCNVKTRAWSPIWYKLDCNDLILTSSDDSVNIAKLDGDCCGWDFTSVADSFYTEDGVLTENRVVDGGGFSVTFDDVSLFRVVNGDGVIGGTYDFTTGVDLLAYNASNSSNLVLDPLSGMQFNYTDLSGPTVLSALGVDGDGIYLVGIQEFADNAAALLGGLTAGYLYRTGDALKIVH